MKVKATRLSVSGTHVRTKEKLEYELETESITEIFDDVRSLWKEGCHLIKVEVSETESLVFDCAPGCRNVFGKIHKAL
jgi:hypothetical protein